MTEADRWDIEAQEFIRRNHKDPTQVANLAQFLKDNPVSALALRGDDAVKFLDILEKVCTSRTYTPVPM